MNEPRDAKTGEGPQAKIRPRGPYLMEGEQRFMVRGLTYGPFPPGPAELEDGYPSRETIERDLDLMQQCGANVLRVYTPPPARLRDACAQRGLRLLVGIPWAQHLDFLEHPSHFETAAEVLRETLDRFREDPMILGFVVANEIPVDMVRWHGRQKVRGFLERLIAAGRRHCPEGLFTYAGFPPTEDLHPRNQDFLTFNVFLHDPGEFQAYLRRLRLASQAQPIILGELGMDTLREGTEAQARMLAAQVPIARNCGFAGSIIFSFTDQWHTGGRTVEDWAFGVVTAQREPKPAWEALQKIWREEPETVSREGPLVSVIVCAFNAAETLASCLQSLVELNYGNREILLIDDGSTDETAEIAARFAEVRHVRVEHVGLSAARNHGAREARGEVLAYTDADCVAEPDWLDHLVAGLTREGTDYAVIGGPNVPPPTRDPVERALAHAPGGPCEVMLNDTEAEHLPGCNLAMWSWAFEKIGGFDEVFHVAGDDVDFCWRATDAGLRLGFAPRAVVWHPRRGSLKAYFKQQQGYGAAEKLLLAKHPHRFTRNLSPRWAGTIYDGRGEAHRIYRGRFGLAGFPAIYSDARQEVMWQEPACGAILAVILVLILLQQWVAAVLLFLAAVLLVWPVTLLARWIRARRDHPPSFFAEEPLAREERRTWIRAKVLQEPVRRMARPVRAWHKKVLERRRMPTAGVPRGKLRTYWRKAYVDREEFLRLLIARLRAVSLRFELDNGWQDWDVHLGMARLYTVVETHRDGFLLKTRLSGSRVKPWLFLWVLIALLSFLCLYQLSPATGSPDPWEVNTLVIPLFFGLLGPVGLVLWLERKQEKRIAAVLDATAREYGLTRVHPVGDERENDAAQDS